MFKVILRCLVISVLVAIPAAAAFATGFVELGELSANGTAAVVLAAAFISALLASWWNAGAVTATAGDPGSDEGVVKWFNVSKGFGFITLDGGGDVFVHFRDIRGKGHRSLTAGQRVAFEIKETDKGPQAHDVTVIGEP